MFITELCVFQYLLFGKGYMYNVKFNMNAQTWLYNHCWLFLLEYFYSSQGGPWSKRLCRPYAYDGNQTVLTTLPLSIVFLQIGPLAIS